MFKIDDGFRFLVQDLKGPVQDFVAGGVCGDGLVVMSNEKDEVGWW